MITHAASRKHYYTVLLDRPITPPSFRLPDLVLSDFSVQRHTPAQRSPDQYRKQDTVCQHGVLDSPIQKQGIAEHNIDQRDP